MNLFKYTAAFLCLLFFDTLLIHPRSGVAIGWYGFARYVDVRTNFLTYLLTTEDGRVNSVVRLEMVCTEVSLSLSRWEFTIASLCRLCFRIYRGGSVCVGVFVVGIVWMVGKGVLCCSELEVFFCI